MAWEALNNIAGGGPTGRHRRQRQRPLVRADRSAASPTSWPACGCARLRARAGDTSRPRCRTPGRRPPAVRRAARHEAGVKDVLAPQGMFEDLGLKYLGPIDGHDLAALESALAPARGFGGPVIVHCVTRKGFGYAPAENDEADQMHQSAAFDPVTGQPVAAPPSAPGPRSSPTSSSAIGERRDDVVAITAAMCEPTGLAPFAAAFPERIFDVGIAEQHALTSAAGLATGRAAPGGRDLRDVPQPGLRPAADGRRAAPAAGHGRAGPSRCHRRRRAEPQRHVGRLDPAVVPGLRIAAPRDAAASAELLAEAVDVADGPTVVRFPKGTVGGDAAAVGARRHGRPLRARGRRGPRRAAGRRRARWP